jgi:Uma2 family endonuclease
MLPRRTRSLDISPSTNLWLQPAIERAGLPYFAAPQGPTVRNHDRNAFEPDALVAALPEPALDSPEIPHPILVVEMLSPSTAGSTGPSRCATISTSNVSGAT